MYAYYLAQPKDGAEAIAWPIPELDLETGHHYENVLAVFSTEEKAKAFRSQWPAVRDGFDVLRINDWDGLVAFLRRHIAEGHTVKWKADGSNLGEYLKHLGELDRFEYSAIDPITVGHKVKADRAIKTIEFCTLAREHRAP